MQSFNKAKQVTLLWLCSFLLSDDAILFKELLKNDLNA